MSEEKKGPGRIVWQDLTVPEAGPIKDFYCEVIGWKAEAAPVADYHDFNIQLPDDGATVAGICHSRGTNANIPPQWLIYTTVENVAESAQKCTDLGGLILDGPRPMGGQQFCVIQDPAGAVMALIGDK